MQPGPKGLQNLLVGVFLSLWLCWVAFGWRAKPVWLPNRRSEWRRSLAGMNFRHFRPAGV